MTADRQPVQWWSASAVKLHLTLVAGLTLCVVASWIEWRRALDGVALAWAYAFEWPLFGVLGLWLWWRLLHGDTPRRPVRRTTARRTSGRRRGDIAEDDPGLIAWREYLAELHGGDDSATG